MEEPHTYKGNGRNFFRSCSSEFEITPRHFVTELQELDISCLQTGWNSLQGCRHCRTGLSSCRETHVRSCSPYTPYQVFDIVVHFDSWASSMWLLCNRTCLKDKGAARMTVGEVLDDSDSCALMETIFNELLGIARRAIRSRHLPYRAPRLLKSRLAECAPRLAAPAQPACFPPRRAYPRHGQGACGRSRYPNHACAAMDDAAAVTARLHAYSRNIAHAVRAHLTRRRPDPSHRAA